MFVFVLKPHLTRGGSKDFFFFALTLCVLEHIERESDAFATLSKLEPLDEDWMIYISTLAN